MGEGPRATTENFARGVARRVRRGCEGLKQLEPFNRGLRAGYGSSALNIIKLLLIIVGSGRLQERGPGLNPEEP